MISKDDVQYIAHLARIHLAPEEIDGLTNDLEAILHYINKLEKVSIDNIEPTSHVLALHNVSRQDSVQPSLNREDVMNFAATQKNGSFSVPQVIES